MPIEVKKIKITKRRAYLPKTTRQSLAIPEHKYKYEVDAIVGENCVILVSTYAKRYMIRRDLRRIIRELNTLEGLEEGLSDKNM